MRIADHLEKTAKERNLLTRHEDASRYRVPVDAASRGPIEVFAPYVRYHLARDAATRSSDKALLSDLEKRRAKSANSAESRALVSEARARGLDVPSWALDEEKPTPSPSTLVPALAGLGGSLVTGFLAEKTLRGKEELLPATTSAREAAGHAYDTALTDRAVYAGPDPYTGKETFADYATRQAKKAYGTAYDEAYTKLTPDQKAAEDIAKELFEKSKVRTVVGGGGARYEFEPANRVVVGAKDHLSTLAHEAGHATGTWGKKALQAVYGPAKLYGIGAMPFLSLGTYAAMGDTSFQGDAEKERERLSNAQKLVGLSALPYAPVLAEEARATARGVAMVNRLRGSGEAVKAALRLTPAFGTYLAAGAAPLAALALLQRKKNKAGKEKGKEESREMRKAAGAVLEKKSATWTPARIHRLADTLGIPWDNDKHFMDFSEQVTGKKHLDAMTEDELSAIAGALVRSCAQVEKRAMEAFEAELEKIANFWLTQLPGLAGRAQGIAARVLTSPTVLRLGSATTPEALASTATAAGVKALGSGAQRGTMRQLIKMRPVGGASGSGGAATAALKAVNRTGGIMKTRANVLGEFAGNLVT